MRRPVAFLSVMAALLLVLFSFAMGHASLSVLAMLLDPASLILTTGGTLAMLLLAFGLRGFRDVYLCLTSAKRTTAHVAATGDFLRFAASASLMCGLFGMLTGALMVLRSLGTPDTLGPAVALILLSQVYGVVQACLCWCVRIRVERLLPADARHARPSGRGVIEASASCAIGTCSVAGIFFVISRVIGPW